MGICVYCMKRNLYVLGGYAKCGTTSVYKALNNAKYLTCGLVKESSYISDLSSHGPKKYFDERKEWNLKAIKKSLKLSPIYTEFSTSTEVSLQTYLDYYLQVSKDYPHPILADFSTTNTGVPLNVWYDFKEFMSPYFNVKCLFIMRHPMERLVSLTNWWGGIDKLERAFNYTKNQYQTNYQKFSSLFDCCSIDGIRFMNEGLGKDKLEKFFEVPIPEFKHRADKPVNNDLDLKISSALMHEIPSTIIKRKVEQMLRKDIEFYKRAVENF